MQLVNDILDNGLRPTLTRNAGLTLVDPLSRTAKDCMESNPLFRPGFEKVVSRLDRLQRTYSALIWKEWN